VVCFGRLPFDAFLDRDQRFTLRMTRCGFDLHVSFSREASMRSARCVRMRA
jgi:hypothetical protein